jgi:multidrug efflux pump
MNLSAPFIHRPVATTLLTIAIAIAGMLAFTVLPVSPLPQVDFPTISVNASLPGGSAEIMASSVATPLERQFGHIAGVTEMTSSSSLGATSITIQFDLSRNIDGAARDVQAAINAARTYLPANLPANPSYRSMVRTNCTTRHRRSFSRGYLRSKALDRSTPAAARFLRCASK